MKYAAGWDEWCGLAGRDGAVRAAVELALDDAERTLSEPCWADELEPALTSLETCRALHCSTHHDADDARLLLNRVIYAAECADVG